MRKIDWAKEVDKRKMELINDTRALLNIKSVLDEENASEEAPLGEGVKQALEFMLAKGANDGFVVKNVDNLAGHIEYGSGEELVGILCHVDVVPEGDGWSCDPYSAEIRDGKIFARGAIDDKGPTMAAYYALKIVKELGVDVNRRVRLIIGTDEESNWRCVDHYFKVEEMPTMGFAPDADFPIIHAEKGIADFDLIQVYKGDKKKRAQIDVLNFQAGRRYNMVPDYARSEMLVHYQQTEVVQRYKDFLKDNQLTGRQYVDSGRLVLELYGISAHAMEPDNGKNAALYLAKFLNDFNCDSLSHHFFHFLIRYFAFDTRGKELGIYCTDDVSGELTVNVGKVTYSKEEGGKIGLNVRYPVTKKIDTIVTNLKSLLAKKGFALARYENSNPHYVEENNFLIQVLKAVYEEQTGDKAELLAIGGGTYARSITKGVAFGALFPGREDIAHQKDEYIFIEDLLKATAIYAQAIYELTR